MRYKIVDESQSVHCCFTKTVVDTTRPVMIHGEHHDDKYEPMCECIDEEAAPVICDALNAADCFRWIPVSERLPEVGEYVLGCWVRRKDGMATAVRRDLNGKTAWSAADQWNEIDPPIAWMPLPAPPEET